MTTIRDILKSKPPEVWSVTPETSVHRVLEIMKARDVGALPIVADERLVGIFSERDCARHLVLEDRSARDTPVSELMSSPVLYVRPEHTIEQCMALMTERRVRHLPVLEAERLIGIVSMRDVVRALLTGRDEHIEQLETYITGGG